MAALSGTRLLCFLLLTFPLSWVGDTSTDGKKKSNITIPVLNAAKTRRLFARKKVSPSPPKRNPKPRPVAPVPRCSDLMESCSSLLPCCDPCATCRCRLFNSVCHCWRVKTMCLKKY